MEEETMSAGQLGTRTYPWLDKADEADRTTWPTKETLRTQLGWQDRTIERWVKKGKLRAVNMRPAGFKSIPCYNPVDVRAMIATGMVRDPTDTTPPPVKLPSAFPRPTDPTDASAVAHVLQFFAHPDMQGAVRAVASLSRLSLSVKTFLSLSESRQLTGLSRETLKSLCRAGRLVAARGPSGRGRYKFKRADLEALSVSDISDIPTPQSAALPTPPTDTNGHLEVNGYVEQ